MAVEYLSKQEDIDSKDSTTVHLIRAGQGTNLVCGETVYLDIFHNKYVTKFSLYESEVTCTACHLMKENK